MLLKIDYEPNQVVFNEEGRLVIRLNYYAAYARGIHLATVKGSTMQDFRENDVLKSKSVFVGQRGGISIE